MTDAPAVDDWLSIAALARLKGVSKQAISKRVRRYVDEGLITTRKHGKELHVRLGDFDRVAGETTDPAQALRNAHVAEVASAPVETAAQGDAPGGPVYSAEKARRESYQAENARLDLEERVGRLCDKREVEHLQMEAFRRVRDRLLGLPAALSERVAAAPDGRAIRIILDEEIRTVLTSLAESFDAMNADDVADAA